MILLKDQQLAPGNGTKNMYMKQKLSTHVDPMEVLLIVKGNSMKIKYPDVSGIRHGHQKYLMSVEVGLKYHEKNYFSDK